MERLKEIQKNEAGPPPPHRPMYHPDYQDQSPTVTARPIHSFPVPSGGPSKRSKRKRSFSELPWSDYFADRKIVEAGSSKFCVYTTGSGPVVLCLHGGGHSSLSWAVFTAELLQRAQVQVIVFDQRGHGDTTTDNDNDLSADTLTRDVGELWAALYPVVEDRPPVVLLGHSMGGAVAIRVAAGQIIPNIRGVAVIDVVEGSAMDALSSMQSVLKRRPKHFADKRKAIEWVLKSGQVRNNESARVSMGGQLKRVTEQEAALLSSSEPVTGTTVLTEEEGDEEGVSERGVTERITSRDVGFTWRVDLSATEHHWSGWYSGMSKLFLSVTAPKLLLLAGPDRLDTELTVAHMQGKFQLQMFNHTGHTVHEDLPDKVADVLSNFLVRQKISNGTFTAQSIRPGC